MTTHNDQAKALFPLSLDGRGARGEGVLRSAKIALAALFLAAPSAALADNECGLDDPSLNGALADSYDCPDPDYPEGVTYAADGDLTVNFTNADSPARSIIGENPDNGDDPTDRGGIDLSATGSDSIIFDSATTGTEIESDGVIGALLSVTTVDGGIDIDAAQVDADTLTSSDVTHGIFAESTGIGSIDIATGNVDTQSGTNPADSIGIEALTTSGGITITTGANVFANGVGIRAVSGSGLIDIDAGDNVDAQSFSSAADSIGIEAVTSSGGINITTADNVIGNEGAIRAVSTSGDVSIQTNGTIGSTSVVTQYGILAETGGSGALSITALDDVRVGNSSSGTAIDATTTGTGNIVIDIVATGSQDPIAGSQGVGIHADAGGDLLIDVGVGRLVDGDIVMDLTAAGETTINNAGEIRATGGSPDELAIRAAGDTFVLNNIGGANDTHGLVNGPIDFSGLENGYVFNNTANAIWDIGIGVASNNLSTQPRISTLGEGTINNAGTIRFGQNKEVILAQGSTFNGSGASSLVMPATLSSVGQDSCADLTPVTGCLDLSGGSTSGQTSILITTLAPPLDPEAGLTNAANPGILLVDVSGGESAAEHFVLDPASDNYQLTSFYGPIINPGPGPMVYTLLYNPNAQQHILSTVPTEEGAEYATFIDETLSIWHTTADAVAGRQADLRGGATGGGWVRLVSERTTRDAGLAMTTHGNDFTFDVGYEQDTRAALFGFDAMYGDNYVIGLHGGLISSETDYDNTGNDNETKGIAAGVYGGWWRDLGIGQLTVDATVNGNFLTLDHDASFEVTHSDIRSLGVRAEAGWKVPVIDGFYVQPLATLAYVRSDIETMELRQNNISFEDAESQRVALGVRLGGHFEAQSGLTARYWLTGRAWDERAEDGRVEYATTGEPLTIADDISGSFEEVGFGASLSNQEDTLSVFASGSTKFIDDVTNYNISVGGRLRW